ncbi:restriction endonuclease subunit S [Microbacterium sp. F2E]|uniref:restriction endonuclease subunit S n=1 Tax=Microbacterium sp. F2E TaxID=2895284 RepID=UPI001E46DA89|nr:restriction endonuclease subunit S [Microbacterium sp. F2E]MCC9055244.1 restriction endonuclease subunit S [Microbacterium sp. F2E]
MTAHPADRWSKTTFGRLARIGNGADYSSVEVEEGGYPVYGSGGEFRRASRYLFDGESVLFGRKGTVDRPLYVDGRFWTVDTMFYSVIDRSRLLPRFAYYWATTLPFGAWATDTALPSMTSTAIKAAPIALPSVPEQRAIADYLDRETAQIDAFIAKNEELITLLTERRAASIDNAFEGLIENPTRLKYRASIQTGVTLGGDGDPVDPEWPYLRVANVQVGWVDLNEIKSIRLPEAKARQSMLRPGDVLMTEGGDRDKLGRGALWSGELDPMLHQNHVFAVRVGPRLDARFLMRWLDASPSRRYFETTAVQTTNLASTNKTLVGNLPLPSCSVNAQLRLVTELDLRLEKIDEAVGIAEHSVRLARERRAALISAAVTGKIDVGVAA